MMGHKKCFDGDIWLIIPKLYLLLLLKCIWRTVQSKSVINDLSVALTALYFIATIK